MNKADMERLWNDSNLINPFKINTFKINTFKNGNLFKGRLTVKRKIEVDVFEASGYYKNRKMAESDLRVKLEAMKSEKYPWRENQDIEWSLRITE